MSEQSTPATPAYPAYPQDKLSIVATYFPAKVGEVVTGGQPERVEIELNELPDGDLGEFITEIVDSLFRNAPDGTQPLVDVDHPRVTNISNTARAEVPA